MGKIKNHYKTIVILALIWAVATSFNITKAVHIDDTAYLEIAKHIMKDPLHPMGGKLNWRDTAEPIHYTNQPPLLFYLYALTMSIFGESVLALHLLISLFTFGAVLFFYLLAREFAEAHALYLTALFCLGPVFLPSQNLMTDIPMLALWLAFFWSILCAGAEGPSTYRYILAATLVAAACLVKYLSLVLVPMLFLHIVLQKRWRSLWTAGIPILFLMAWSAFNYFDYQGVHIISRRTPSWDIVWAFTGPTAYLIGLGALSPFSIVGIPYLLRNKRLFLIEGLLVGAMVFLLGLFYVRDSIVHSFLRACFFANGLLLAGLTLGFLYRAIKGSWGLRRFEDMNRYLVLSAWFLGSTLFIVLFAPFMAARHFLLVLPVVILMLGVGITDKIPRAWLRAGLVATLFFGIALGVSDWTYADIYRVQAGRIKDHLAAKSEATMWYMGHLGWQWYAAKAGMEQYDTRLTRFKKGDFLVEPLMVSKQTMEPEHKRLLTKVEDIIIPPRPTNIFRINSEEPRGGYYRFSAFSLPWTLSTKPLERFTIYRVDTQRDEEPPAAVPLKAGRAPDR